MKDVAPRPGNPFGSAAAAGIVLLTSEEEARVLSHPFHKVPLITSVSADRKLYGEEAAKRRGAPVPAEGVRRGIMHMRNAPASVYWFRLEINGKIVGHKIGWAFDWRQRLRQFNSIALSTLGGLRYRQHSIQDFNTAREAYNVEQGLLKAFDHLRHSSNREVITGIKVKQIEEVWHVHITSVMLGSRLQ